MVDSDGKTHLDKPYCALQKECFGGIVGAKSPYADGLGLLGQSNMDISQAIDLWNLSFVNILFKVTVCFFLRLVFFFGSIISFFKAVLAICLQLNNFSVAFHTDYRIQVKYKMYQHRSMS